MSTLNLSVVDMLFQSSSISKGIEKTVDYLADTYFPNYMAIAELKGETVSVNYEWVKDDKYNVPDILEYISICEIHDHFGETGAFYRDDFSSMDKEEQDFYATHNVKAVLECQLRDVGKTIGYMFYFWCDKEMAPDLIDVYDIQIITKLISENVRRELIDCPVVKDMVDIPVYDSTVKRMALAIRQKYTKVVEVNAIDDTYVDTSKKTTEQQGKGLFTTDILSRFDGRLLEDQKDAFYKLFDRENLVIQYNRGKREISSEFAYIDVDGTEYWLGIRLILVEGGFDKDNTYLVCFKDISEEKKKQILHDEEINQAILESRATSEAKGTFLASLSHDIRTPMNNIIGMTSIAKKVIDDKEKTLECLSNIESSSAHLLNLMDDMLDMSRLEEGEIELSVDSFDLDKLLSDIDILMRPKVEDKVATFQINKKFKNPIVFGDKYRLNQILLNLISNGIYLVDKGDKLSVDVEQVGFSKDIIYMRFFVKSTGRYISKKVQEQLFKAFETSTVDTVRDLGDEEFKIILTNKLINLLGGNLSINSREGLGTELYFTIPFKRGDYINTNYELETSYTSNRITDFSGRSALVAEDEDLNADTLIALLEVVGFKVTRVKNGRQAVISFISNTTDFYDVVLLDIHMPVMDGREAAKCIRISGKDDSKYIPIIGLAANTYSEDEKKSQDSGMNVHMSKPIDVEYLYSTLSELIIEKDRIKMEN